MPQTLVNLPLFISVFRNMYNNRVLYGLGSKAASLTMDSHLIRRIDCSGFERFALAKASNQQFIVPDGSYNILDYFENGGFHKLAKYSDVTLADPNRLFIAFILANHNGCGDVGHVWNVCNKMTMESHGGVNHNGVDSRQWDYTTLKDQVYACYEIPVSI